MVLHLAQLGKGRCDGRLGLSPSVRHVTEMGDRLSAGAMASSKFSDAPH